jgi:hypothetical protein
VDESALLPVISVSKRWARAYFAAIVESSTGHPTPLLNHTHLDIPRAYEGLAKWL